MRSQWLLISILLMTIIFSGNNFAFGINENNQVPTNIVSYTNNPLIPKENENIVIYATLSNVPTNFNNLTLVYTINNGLEVRELMINMEGIQFNYEIPGQSNGTVLKYYLVLYYNNLLSDRAPNTSNVEIIIGVIPNSLVMRPGSPISIGSGNYSLIDEEDSITLYISVVTNVKLSFDIIDRGNSPLISRYQQLTNLFTITINDTTAVSSSSIIIPYNKNYLSEIGAIESRIELLTRENSDNPWEIYPSLIDTVNNRVIANVTHFSDWTVASSKAALRFLEVKYEQEILSKSNNDIIVVATNIGNTIADNVLIQLFIPKGIFLVNQSNFIIIPILKPLQNITHFFEIFADEDGIYTIVITISSENINDDDIAEITMEANTFTDNIGSSTNTDKLEINSIQIVYFISSIIIIVNIRRVRRK